MSLNSMQERQSHLAEHWSAFFMSLVAATLATYGFASTQASAAPIHFRPEFSVSSVTEATSVYLIRQSQFRALSAQVSADGLVKSIDKRDVGGGYLEVTVVFSQFGDQFVPTADELAVYESLAPVRAAQEARELLAAYNSAPLGDFILSTSATGASFWMFVKNFTLYIIVDPGFLAPGMVPGTRPPGWGNITTSSDVHRHYDLSRYFVSTDRYGRKTYAVPGMPIFKSLSLIYSGSGYTVDRTHPDPLDRELMVFHIVGGGALGSGDMTPLIGGPRPVR